MLVLKRKEGQWIEVTHKGGDRLRIRAFRIEGGTPGRVDLAFDDAARNFEIQRPERGRKAAEEWAEFFAIDNDHDRMTDDGAPPREFRRETPRRVLGTDAAHEELPAELDPPEAAEAPGRVDPSRTPGA